MKPPGRIFQDDHFDVPGFEGEVIEELIGILAPDDPDNQPILIYLKASNKTWQKYFLDALLAFWEDWGDIEIEEGDKIVDYGEMFGVKGEVIKYISCRDSAITLVTKNNSKIILRHIEPRIDDLGIEIVHLVHQA